MEEEHTARDNHTDALEEEIENMSVNTINVIGNVHSMKEEEKKKTKKTKKKKKSVVAVKRDNHMPGTNDFESTVTMDPQEFNEMLKGAQECT